jgi:hypothetical protein
VSNIAADTSQNRAVAASVQEDGTLQSGFYDALGKLAKPTCTYSLEQGLGNGGSPSTICWRVEDGRA